MGPHVVKINVMDMYWFIFVSMWSIYSLVQYHPECYSVLLLHGIAALVVPSVAIAHLCRFVLEAECFRQHALQLNVMSVSVYDLLQHHAVVIYFCML